MTPSKASSQDVNGYVGFRGQDMYCLHLSQHMDANWRFSLVFLCFDESDLSFTFWLWKCLNLHLMISGVGHRCQKDWSLRSRSYGKYSVALVTSHLIYVVMATCTCISVRVYSSERLCHALAQRLSPFISELYFSCDPPYPIPHEVAIRITRNTAVLSLLSQLANWFSNVLSDFWETPRWHREKSQWPAQGLSFEALGL